MPTVSVVIPAYNNAHLICETLDSVLAQTYQDFEVIVIDDGSTDITSKVVWEYGKGVRYIRKQNGGAASARNLGIEAAQGTFLAFIDSDDLWLPEKLQLQMQLFNQSSNLAWVYCDGFVFDSNSGKSKYRWNMYNIMQEGDILPSLFLQDFIPSPTPVIKRQVFAEVGVFDESTIMRGVEDWDMWLRIAAKYPVKLLNQPLVRYRLHSQSTTASKSPLDSLQSQLSVIEKAVSSHPKELSHLKNRAIANRLIDTGYLMWQQGNISEARNLLVESLRLFPYNLKSYQYIFETFLSRSSRESLLKSKEKLWKIILNHEKS